MEKKFKRHFCGIKSGKKLTVEVIEKDNNIIFYYKDMVFNTEKELNNFLKNYFKTGV